MRASDLLHAISAPQIPTTAAQNIAQRRAQFEQYIAGLNRAIMEKEPFLGLFRVDWKERRLIRDAQVTLRQLERAGQQEVYQAACTAGKVARHMSPTDIFVNENSGDLVTQLNKAVFEAAYLPRAPGQSSAQRCPATYAAFLQQYDSARLALFQRYLAVCEDRPAAQAAGYPRDTPASEEDLQQLKLSATSPSHQQLVRSIIAAALRLCPADPFKDPERLDDMSAARCAGLPEGTDREALLRRLRVIRGVLHTEFYNAFGIRDDAAAIAKAWGKVKRHIERLEER